MTGGFWNRFGVVLIEAPVSDVTSTLSKYFNASCCTDVFPVPLVFSESHGEQRKHFLWQYSKHNWTVWWAFSSEEVAFALSLFLETKAIVLTHQGTSIWSTFKLFCQDKWVEYYHFGHDDYDDPNEKIGDRGWGTGYWDLEVTYDYFVSQSSTFPIQTRHLFSSSTRKVTEFEMRTALESSTDEYGFLDATLQHYGAYLPNCDETPLTYSRSDRAFHPVRSDFERVDSIVLPKEAIYWKNMLPTPNCVEKIAG